MGWPELQQKLIRLDSNYFLDLNSERYRKTLLKLMKEEFPKQDDNRLAETIERAKHNLLPPVSKTRLTRWLQNNLPPA